MKIRTLWRWLILSKTPLAGAGPSWTTALRSAQIDLGFAAASPLRTCPEAVTSLLRYRGLELRGPHRGGFGTAQPCAPLQRAGAGTRTHRHLDHAFVVAGLHRFSEHMGGSNVNLLVFRNLLATASPQWLLEVYSFQSRLYQVFRLARGFYASAINSPRHPWFGGPQMLISSIHARDPFLLTQWINRRMRSMRLFTHKKFLRLLGSFLRSYVSPTPLPGALLGFTLVTTGKISVTGNAMSRTMFVRCGKSGVNNLNYRASASFTLIRTQTGCLGLNLVFYY